MQLVLAWSLTAPAPTYVPPSAATVRGERARASQREASDATRPVTLTEQTDGGLLYVDPGNRFTAWIGPDGAVRFADRWRRPARRRAIRKRERGGCCGVPGEGFFHATNAFVGAPVSGPTEWIFAARRRDPAAAAKAEFLKRTAALRTKRAVSWMRAQMQHQLDALEDNLQRLWADPTVPPARKRAILFRQWDELSEPAPRPAIQPGARDPADSDLRRLRASYGRRGRWRIEAFVRRRLPAASAGAFSPTELSRLNAGRQSIDVFAPYRRPFGEATARRPARHK